MKPSIELILIPLVLAGLYLAASWHLFFFASCDTVREHWLLVQTPARCITHGASGNW